MKLTSFSAENIGAGMFVIEEIREQGGTDQLEEILVNKACCVPYISTPPSDLLRPQIELHIKNVFQFDKEQPI
jgi:hypothetical protein